ncbi:phage baseplate protein [Leptothoe sp. PORK10 BA2]|uniref:phage baseplate protein n=1 Tax=Leptothoe sp. PORK10 BA2 TaxID=3110254 RepID=UPI002B20D38E|nr:hypothetical protein [Leptothoe sp. PORK10 BA2]MEA5465266.1 hypothetical protein [Leptothoe sp. PORK10 BA2]
MTTSYEAGFIALLESLITTINGTIPVMADPTNFETRVFQLMEAFKSNLTTLITQGTELPVGSIYANADVATNPSTLLGYGTWVSFGEGRCLMGYDVSQTEFNAGGKTGGAKTVALVASQNGAHIHDVTDPGHAHIKASTFSTAGGASADPNLWPVSLSIFGGGPIATSPNFTGVSVNSSGSGNPHQNLAPYVTVYYWRRTA